MQLTDICASYHAKRAVEVALAMSHQQDIAYVSDLAPDCITFEGALAHVLGLDFGTYVTALADVFGGNHFPQSLTTCVPLQTSHNARLFGCRFWNASIPPRQYSLAWILRL